MKRLKLGTRGSPLALWQAKHVVGELKSELPSLDIEICIIKTKGDKILDVALSKIGDKGLFTVEIENALLAGEVDLAVHSMKDLPSFLAPGLALGAVLERENPQDVLLSSKGYTLATLPQGGILGTSSLRRISQLKAMRPDLRTVDLRGNVDTRIKKMVEQDLDGIILAYAGVMRLNFTDRISEMISLQSILPAVGQGAIAVEIREDDDYARQVLEVINDSFSNIATRSERSFLRELEGGCQIPVGALADVKEDVLYLEGMIASLNGQQIFKGSIAGHWDQAEELGKKLAQNLLDMGGRAVLEEIRSLGE